MLAILSMIRQKYRVGKIDWPKDEIVYWLKRFALFFFLIAVGTAYAFLKYTTDNSVIISLLVREAVELLSYSAAFLLVIYHGRQKNFTTYALIAFLSNLGLSLFAIFHRISLYVKVVNEDLLQGFHAYRSTFGHLLIVTFIILLALFIKTNGIKKLAAWVALIFATALSLWSGSRNAYLIMPLATLYAAYELYRTKQITKIFTLAWKTIFISLATFLIACAILPFTARNMVLYRFFPQFMFLSSTSVQKAADLGLKTTNIELPNPYERDQTKIIVDATATVATVETKELIKAVLQNPKPQITENRLSTWSQAIKLTAISPLGASTQFYSMSGAVTNSEGVIAGGHNTFFQIALSSGWLGLALFLFFIWKIFSHIKNSRDTSWQWFAISAIWGNMVLTFFFDDWLFAPWIWVVAGLAIAYDLDDNRAELSR